MRAVRAAGARLTATEAAARSRRVSDVDYRLHLELDGDSDEFAGRVRIGFELRQADEPLRLDFAGGDVVRIRVNDVDVDADYNGHFLLLPPDALAVGRNTVAIAYRHRYGRNGAGLHRLVDPEDGEVYLYSHFEPFDANRCLPCFDQPDLKAKWELHVDAPPDWTVVSATREDRIEPVAGRTRWHFRRSARFSPYLFSVHAGPYVSWQDSADEIPLRLFARRTMAAHVEADHWFDLTRRGFVFFEDYFAAPYPYGKYDCVIVPDFNIGAMENVASVTFSENYLTRGTPTRRDRRRLADVVLHEMSHMWFGNLVTMPWWDGLWLKESFATYMAHLACELAVGIDDIWHAFSVESRQRALRADQQVTTHPIDVPVPDTADAFAQFDAITYNKGASVLAQLAHYVGPRSFRDGVRQYLAAHAGGTATLDDFVAALAAATDAPLDGWIDEWIRTTGVNTLVADPTLGADRLEGLAITQHAPDAHPTLRRHRVNVGLYRADAGRRVETLSLIPVVVRGEKTVVPVEPGTPAPTLVCPNAGDWTFARFEPDAVTLEHLPSLLPTLPDAMLRSQFVQAMWDLVRDARLPLQRYLDPVLRLVETDESDLVCRHALATVEEALGVVARGVPATEALLARVSAMLDRVLAARLASKNLLPDLRWLFIDALLAAGHDVDALEALLDLPQDAPTAPDIDRRWRAVARLAALGAASAPARIDAEAMRDRSDRGTKMALAARAALPDAAAKTAWLDQLLDPDDDLPLSRQRMVLGALFPNTQTALHAEQAERIVDAIPIVSETRDPAFQRAFAFILPAGSDPANRARLKHAAETADNLHPVLSRAVREANEEAGREARIVDVALTEAAAGAMR